MPSDLDDLIDFHSDEVFATEDYFGETIEFAPRGDWSQKSQQVAVVVPDQAVGSNENRGDGVRLHREKGISHRTSIIVEFKNDAPLQKVQSPQRPDKIRYNGQVWSAVRTVSFDRSMKAALFVSTKDQVSHGQSMRG